MSSEVLIAAIVGATDVLTPMTFLTTGWALRRSRVAGPTLPWIALPLALALAWGLVWTFVPAVAAVRLNPPPFGQAGAILAVVLGLTGLLAFAPARHFFRTARVEKLVMLGLWRPIYGGALLTLGLLGGLPDKFFWSAAFGDIAVGLWAATLLWRGKTGADHEVTAWNIVGLLDLSHVLVLGALYLRDFYMANPAVAPLNLLPLAGVPLFLAIHLLTLWGIWVRRGAAR
jgi:hypothetical protein